MSNVKKNAVKLQHDQESGKIFIGDPNKIGPSKFNPRARMEEPSLRELDALIVEAEKILEPVPVISENGKLRLYGDGNGRRILAIRHGYPLPYFFADTSISEERFYAMKNAGQRKTNSFNNLELFLEGIVDAIPHRLRKVFEKQSETFGIKTMQRLHRKGLSNHQLNVAIQFMNRMEIEPNKSNANKVVRWMLRHNQVAWVKDALAAKDDLAPIWDAIKQNRKLTRSVQ